MEANQNSLGAADSKPAGELKSRDIFDIPALLFIALMIVVLPLAAQRYAAVGSDFEADYAAVRSAISGGPIYGSRILQIQRELGYSETIPNNHPPTSIIFFVPFVGLDPQTAFLIFNLISLLLFVLALETVLRSEGVDRRKRAVIEILLILWPPTFGCLALGQTSLLLGAAALLSWHCWKNGRDFSAGAACGCAALAKLFPFFTVVLFIGQRRLRAAVAALVIFAGGTVLGAALVGPAAFFEYMQIVLPFHQAESSMIPYNISLTGLILPIFKSGPWSHPLVEMPRLAAVVIAVLQIALAAITIRACFADDRGSERELFSAVLVAALLISPITWGHYLSIAVLPLVACEISSDRKSKNIGRLCMLLIVSASAIPIQNWVIDGKLVWYQCLPAKLGGAALLGLWSKLIFSNRSSKVAGI